MAVSQFHAALESRETYEIGFNEVGLVVTDPSSKIRAVGTQNLNGCTAVAIVSPSAAILGHISPMPFPTHDGEAGLKNVSQKMHEVEELFTQSGRHFLSDTFSLVVGASRQGLALPHHLHFAKMILQKLGLQPVIETYEVSSGGHANDKQGTIFVDGRRDPVTVYVEDRNVVALNTLSSFSGGADQIESPQKPPTFNEWLIARPPCPNMLPA